MKNTILLASLLMTLFLVGCTTNNNFMDIDNPNAKDDLQKIMGNGNIKKIKTKDIIPDNLSGTIDSAKTYANKYYEDTLEGYVDTAKQGLSGTTKKLKGYYNSGVDQLNTTITNKVNGTISGEINKLKLK